MKAYQMEKLVAVSRYARFFPTLPAEIRRDGADENTLSGRRLLRFRFCPASDGRRGRMGKKQKRLRGSFHEKENLGLVRADL